MGLDHLSLGRAHSSGSAEAGNHLDQAVDIIRRAGQLDDLPRGLLARGTRKDLDEAFRIDTGSGMRLYLADYHIACVVHATRDGISRNQARAHVEMAKALVQETGYRRRDNDLRRFAAI